MAIELTSASKSTRLGVLSALNANITGFPYLDGTPSNVILLHISDALEGISIPDGATDVFTKTFELGTTLPKAYVVTNPGFASPMYNVPYPSYCNQLMGLRSLSADARSGFGGPSYFRDYVGGPGHFYVTTDYTQSKRFDFLSTSFEADQNNSLRFGGYGYLLYGLSYTELNNELMGYYAGPYGGGGGHFATQNGSFYVIRSVYLNGTQLVFNLKKAGSSSSDTFKSQAIAVIPWE